MQLLGQEFALLSSWLSDLFQLNLSCVMWLIKYELHERKRKLFQVRQEGDKFRFSALQDNTSTPECLAILQWPCGFLCYWFARQSETEPWDTAVIPSKASSSGQARESTYPSNGFIASCSSRQMPLTNTQLWFSNTGSASARAVGWQIFSPCTLEVLSLPQHLLSWCSLQPSLPSCCATEPSSLPSVCSSSI